MKAADDSSDAVTVTHQRTHRYTTVHHGTALHAVNCVALSAFHWSENYHLLNSLRFLQVL